MFTLALVVLMGFGTPPLPYRRGQVIKTAIRARVGFQVVDEEKTRAAREKAHAEAPNVYRAARSSFERAESNLREALALVRGAGEFGDIDAAKAQSLGLDEEFFAALEAGGDEQGDLLKIAPAVSQAVARIIRQGALSESDAKQEASLPAKRIIIIDGEERFSRALPELADAGTLDAVLQRYLKDDFGPTALTDTLVAYISPFLKPFLFYDEAESKLQREAAAEKAGEKWQVFDRGDVLVRGDTLIDKQQMRVLQKEHDTYLAKVPAADRAWRLTGLTITVLLLVALFGAYTLRYEPRVLARKVRMLVLMLLAVIMAAASRYVVRSSLPLYLVPLPLFAMAVAVAYNQQFALGYTLFLAMITGIATGSNFGLSVSLFLGSTVGILAMRRVTSRPRPFLAGLAAGAGIFIGGWGTGLLFHTDYKLSFADGAYGFVNGAVCGIAITVLLPFIERAFNVITDLSLLEMADLNKPVLRRLALEAPGTYNHSLFVGNLADAAAQMVGANRLFARVGGYYHDIGKLSKPDYFVENHGTASSRHHDLSPTMSALVIISHVKDGVELAREHKLPGSVIDIIREHHGTTLVEYFYQEAVAKAEDTRAVSEGSFRYPGPKPRTKEAAIIMVADSIESASRTVDDPTPSKLESLVSDIVRKKLSDGQFDECNITLADLKRIETSFTKSLAGIFHSRIKYPGKEI